MKHLTILTLVIASFTGVSCVNDSFKNPDFSGDCSTLTATKTVQEVVGSASAS